MFKLQQLVLLRKGNYHLGIADRFNFRETGVFRSFEDIKEILRKPYVPQPLLYPLKDVIDDYQGKKDKCSYSFLKEKFNAEEIWISEDFPYNNTDKEWHAYYWRRLNKLCLECQKSCKQSWIATVVSCPAHVKTKREKPKK